jgi:DNA-binding transcriptional MerR regulator
MAKSPEAFRTIREVAEQLDVPAHVLRFWETRFTQIKPVKRGGGRRYYRPDDVRLLRGIRGLLYDDGMTIKGVQKILREQGVRHVIGLGTVDEPATAPPPPPRKSPSAPPAATPAARPEPAFAGADAAPQGDPFPPPAAASAGDEAPAARPEAAGEGTGDAASAAAAEPGQPEPRDGRAERRPAGPGSGGNALDREALRRLVRELEALRAVMVGEPGR